MLQALAPFSKFRERAAVVSEALNLDVIRDLPKAGPDTLNQNRVSSLLTALVGVTIFEQIGRTTPDGPACLAGYSVGQLVALQVAECFSFTQLVEMIAARCCFMDEDIAETPSAMLAVIGLNEASISAVCAEVSTPPEILVISNYNATGHYSLAGTLRAIEQALERCQSMGAKRTLRLPVNGGWHSPFLDRAAGRFGDYLASIDLQPMRTPVTDNVTGGLLPNDVEALRRLLVQHVCRPVRWSDCVKTMVAAGCTEFVECGHGKILTRVGPFIDRSVRFLSWEELLALTGG